MFVLAYAFLTTYQAYYLLEKIGSAEDDVPRQIFLGTLAMSVAIVTASLLGGWLSDRTGRRKAFVCTASFVFGLAMFAIAVASSFNGFLVGMAIAGLGFGLYMAVDLALVADVLPDQDNVAKDLGVLNIAGALPSSIAPAIAPAILAVEQRKLRRAVRRRRGLRRHRSRRHPAREAGPVRMSAPPLLEVPRRRRPTVRCCATRRPATHSPCHRATPRNGAGTHGPCGSLGASRRAP